MSRMGVCRAITAPFLLHAAQKQQIQSVTPFPITATLGVQKGSQSAALCGVTVLKQRRDFIICTSPFCVGFLYPQTIPAWRGLMAPRPRSAHSWVRAEGDPAGPGRAGRAHTAPRGCPDSSRAVGQQWGCRSPRAPALLTPRRDAAAVATELMRADLRSDGRSAAGCAEVPCCSSTGRRWMQALPSRQRILTALLCSSPLPAIPQSLLCNQEAR